MAENRYLADYAKLGTSSCKKCKQKIEKGGLRLAKVVKNPFTDEGGEMKQYFHTNCMFDTLMNARATTQVIESTTDIDGWSGLQPADKEQILEQIKRLEEVRGKKKDKSLTQPPSKKIIQKILPVPSVSPTKKKQTLMPVVTSTTTNEDDDGDSEDTIDDDDENINVSEDENDGSITSDDPTHPDNSFRSYRNLCMKIAEVDGHKAKTEVIRQFITYGTDDDSYKGNLSILYHLLLPAKGYKSSIFNLKSRQLCKLFSTIFQVEQSEMLTHCEEGGDIADTVAEFYEQSPAMDPPSKSTLSIYDIDNYLLKLSKLTKENDQERLLHEITIKCTSNDLKMFIRLTQKDLKINAGPKQILDALDINAYDAYQHSNNLKTFVDRYLQHKSSGSPTKLSLAKAFSVQIELMTPVHPMLAEACKSVDYAFKKCKNTILAEIKYDGERLQLHKNKNKFEFFSRNLKSVQQHKVQDLNKYITEAFPKADDLILDGEILLIDIKTKKPLPFGTLGVHKKAKYSEANIAFFVFDCLYFNGESLLDLPLKERRTILTKHMSPIENRILISEQKLVTKKSELQTLINYAISEGLEGLVLKDPESLYEPGKRHWLKVKKDYLLEGAMADTCDLVVLGAYYGTGKKGGLMSVFLLGCYDQTKQQWCTVCKCGNGFDDAKIDQLQKELKPNLIKISKDMKKVPNWLNLNRQYAPDFVVVDPKKSPVWEITGAEFSQSKAHTANGISIRFPRVTKVRDDKTWKEATNLAYLIKLFEKSKPTVIFKDEDMNDEIDEDELGFSFSNNTNNNNGIDEKSLKRSVDDVETSEVSKKKAVATNNGNSSMVTCSFPTLFDAYVFYLSSTISADEKANLTRFINAFDGDIINDENEYEMITHYVGKKDKNYNKIEQRTKFQHIQTDYLWDCIKNKKKL